MNNYPDAVAKIAADYLDRVKAQLAPMPAAERDEFLREIESHIFEAYQAMPGDDEVARILAVLRNLGEPAEVVADRLPASMVRSGTKRNTPLYVVGGILIGLFGLPLGFSGVSVLLGLLAGLATVVATFYAAAGVILFASALFLLMGLVRLMMPGLWDQLAALGFIQIQIPGYTFDQLPGDEQALLLVLAGAILGAAGFGMLWVGKRMLRGLRFLLTLAVERSRALAQAIRQRLQGKKNAGSGANPALRTSTTRA